MCFSQVGFCLIHKHYTRPVKLAGDKHSSFLKTLVGYGRKKFYNIGPGNDQVSYSDGCPAADGPTKSRNGMIEVV
jgi:hypothetical protein